MAPFQKRSRPAFGSRSRPSGAPGIPNAPSKPPSAPRPRGHAFGFSSKRLGLDDERRCLLRVSCEPGSEVLHDLESFVSAYLKRRFRPSLAQSVATASYELCSNAISYASVATDIIFEIWSSTTTIEVEVQNEAVSARLDVLRQITERIQGNPEHAYLEEMRRSIAGKMPRPMLGLARVAHEAAMELEVVVADRRVKVIARCPR